MRFLLFFMVGLMLSFSVTAQEKAPSYMSGHDLKTYCMSSYDTDFGYCAGYVTGVADLMFEHSLYGLQACHNQYIKSQQLVDMVRIHMKEHPEQLGKNARFLVADILAQSYPCL